MIDLKERIADVSQYLEHLLDPVVFPEVQSAVERKDKDSVIEVCRKLKIPEIYLGVIVSVLFSIVPRQKWPDWY